MKTKLLVVLQGGMISAICSNDPDVLKNVDVISVDYDTDGASEDDVLCEIPQGDLHGATIGAYVSSHNIQEADPAIVEAVVDFCDQTLPEPAPEPRAGLKKSSRELLLEAVKTVVENWPEFQTGESISGADLVDFMGGWMLEATCAIAAAEAEDKLGKTSPKYQPSEPDRPTVEPD